MFSVMAIWMTASLIFMFFFIKDLKNATSYFEILKVLLLNGTYFACLREFKKKTKKKLDRLEKELEEYINATGGM